MKKILSYSLIITVIGVVASLIFCQPNTYAETSLTGSQSLEIGPTLLSLEADPGSTIETKLSVRNISSGDLVVTVDVNDFIASGEEGIPKILTENDEPSPYSMISWITPISEMTLNPKQVVDVPVKITVPANQAPGGYYCTVRFSGNAPELENTGVSLSASVGPLLFVRVSGEAKEDMSLEDFFVGYNRDPSNADSETKRGSFFETGPLNFVVRLKNDGNIFEQATGLITVTDMFNNQLATLLVNAAEKNILPQSIRKFDQALDSSVIGNKMLFGKYTAKVDIKYGTNQTLSKTIVFWVIPYTLILCIILGLIAIFLVLRFLIRRYNEHILAGGSSRYRRK